MRERDSEPDNETGRKTSKLKICDAKAIAEAADACSRATVRPRTGRPLPQPGPPRKSQKAVAYVRTVASPVIL